MVVSGLGLLLGERADSSLVRGGATRAVVEGMVRVPADDRFRARLDELEADVDDGVLVVSRTVACDGRSRAFVGGRAVPVGVLAELMSHLVAVHGQAEQLRLRQPASHRLLLDQYAGDAVARPLSAYQTAYARHREVTAELHDCQTRTQERAREADLLRFGVEEISAAAPEPGEDNTLATEVARLSHIDALETAVAAGRDNLLGDADDVPDAQRLLAASRSALEGVGEHDVAVAELAQRVREIEVLVADIGLDLA